MMAAVRLAEPPDDPTAPAGPDAGHGLTEDHRARVEAALNRARDRASKREARRQEAEQDRVLVERVRAGEEGAFRELVTRHHRRAFVVAHGLLRDEQDAEEVVQEAFLRVHRGLDGFTGGASFFTWLYRIVTNLAIDQMRRPARRDLPLPEDRELGTEAGDGALLAHLDGSDPREMAERAELRLRIQAALDALPPYHRGVILLREVEGLSYEEMAQAMGVSKGTIMSRLFHARQKLQRALAACYEEQVGPRRSRGDGQG